MQISPSEYKSLCAFYGFETVHAILNTADEKSLQLAKDFRLEQYNGRKFQALGRKITTQEG